MYNLDLSIMIPMLILAGFASSIIASLIGVGGGLVAIPIILLVIGDHTVEAKAIAYVSIAALSVVAIFKYKKQGLSPEWRTAFYVLIGVIPLTVICEIYVGPALDNEELKMYFNLLFAIVTVFVLLLVVFKDRIKVNKLKNWQLPFAGAVIGSVAGSLGISGGVLFMPLLTVWMKMDIKKAAVSTLSLKLFTALANISAAGISGQFSAFESHGVIWFAPLIIIIGSITGSQIGPLLSKKMSNKAMQNTFITTMSLIAIWELINFITKMVGVDII